MISVLYLFDSWAASPIQPPIGSSNVDYQKIIDRNLKKGDGNTTLIKRNKKMISISELSPSPIIPNRGIYKPQPVPSQLKKNRFSLRKSRTVSYPSTNRAMGMNLIKARKNKNTGEFGPRWSGTSSMLMNRNPGPGTKMANVPFRR